VFVAVTLIDSLVDPNRRTVVLVATGCVMAFANVLIPTSPNIVGLRSALYLGPFFIAGLLAKRFDWRSAGKRYRVLVIVALVPLIAITQLGVHGVIPYFPPRTSLVATVTGVVACMCVLLVKWEWKPLALIGAYSFTIYLFHVPVTVGTHCDEVSRCHGDSSDLYRRNTCRDCYADSRRETRAAESVD
jgi:peptidoglycan/LPS O-acetylase OafA/YrhL